MDKIELVKNAIRNAENLDSKLTQDILKIEGYSSPKVRHFLNNLINEDSTYLEIGTYKGSTLISALFQNDCKYAVAIDNFSLFGGPKHEFYNNIRKYLSSEKLYFYDDSFENVDLSNFRFNTYFYDGEHEETNQYNAFLLMDKYLESDFIAIVDDYNWEKVQKGTKEAFRKLNYKVLYEQVLPAHIVGDTENWWNGLYVAVIQKQPVTPAIAGYCVVRNAEYLSYPFYDAIYQCLDNVDEFHIFYDVGSEDETVSLTKKFVNTLRDYSSIEMHPIQVDWKDQSAISHAQNLGAQFLKEKGFEFVLLNQADEFLPVGMKEFLRGCYRNKQQVGFDVIHTWKDEYIITKARYCRFYRSDTEFTGDGANVCGTEVNDFVMHTDPVHHFGTLFHPQRKYASHSKLYGSKDQEYIAANANDLDKVQEGFKRLIGTEKFIRRTFPLREREYITVRYSREHGTYPFDLALQEIVADFRRKRNCKESFAITYSNTQGFRESLAVSPAWTDAYGVVESLIKKFNVKTGAEIGVARGHHSAHLLEANPNLKWIAIDSWKHMVHGYEDPFNRPQEQFDETYESARKLLGQFGDRITILRNTSREASEIVQEKLDIVFIDANHSYESVKEDIALWWNKVKPGGIIAGHDYDHPNFPGTKRAVDEFLGSKGLIPTIELGTVWWAQKRPGHFLTYIIPCYNCAGTVFEAIKSIYQQHLDIPFEVICTEDGSTDSTRQILSYCQKKLPNFHVYYHDQNKGGATARNTCVANSRGDLIFCLDSDNILTLDSVGKLINLMDDTGCDGASFAELRYFEGTKGIYRHTNSWFFEAPNNISDISHILSTKKTPAASGNYLYTRESYDRAGGYAEGRGAMDSWGFGFRQHATGTKIAILPDSFYWHRLSSSSYWTREEKTGANSKNAARIVREFPELFTDETNRFLATAEAEKCFFGHLESGRLKTVSGQSLVCPSQDAVVSTRGSRDLLSIQNDGFNVGNLQACSDHAEIKPMSDAVARIKRAGSQQEGNHIRLHIGCGPRVLKGWVNIDLAFEPCENYMKYYTDEFYGPNVRGTKDDFLALDVTKGPLPFADNSVDVIFDEDFIEHLDQRQIMLFLAESFRVLKPGGVHRVTTPDLMWIMQNYSDFSKGYPGVYQDTWHKWRHKDHLTRRYLEDVAAMVGYRVVFQKRDVSLSPGIPKEYRPDKKRSGPDKGHIFADLVKVDSVSESNVLDSKNCLCNNLTYDADVMKSGSEKFYEENLVCPESLEDLTFANQTITTSSGRTYRFENSIPCFLSSSVLTEHQKSELESTKVYIQDIMNNSNPHYSPEKPFIQPKICWDWSEKWLNSKTVHSNTKIVCIGGSFADDLPHVHSDYKFNIDHLANEYCKLLPEILKANTHHIACTAEKMPFRNNYADFVYARNSLDHVCNPVQTLKEIYRILRPGGKLLIGVYFNSTFINEHESTVIDDEFIDRCIKPIFEIEHRVIYGAPQKQEIFGSEKAGFIHLVCRKLPHSDLSFTQEQIQAVGNILSNFHSALYCEAHGKLELARDKYSRLLRIQPVLTTDIWRMIYSLIRFFGMTDPRKFNDLKQVIVNLLGHDLFWKKVLNKTAQDYAAAISSDPIKDDFANCMKILDAPGIIEGWRILWYLAMAAHKIGRVSVAERVAAAVIHHEPNFMDAHLFLKKLDGSAVAHQHRTDINSNISAGHQLSLGENIVEQLKRKGLLHTNQPLRLHLGCGEQHLEGYINIDYPQSEHNLVQVKADICADIKSLDFPLGSVDEIRLHHVFEHFSRVTALAMLIKWHKWLKIGGRLHIETPDLIGSAKTLVSNTSWKTKMGAVRHLAGDQAANWGYHIDHWFAERFEHTLEALGFGEIQTLSSSWPKEPYLSNVKVVAMKSRPFSLQEQLKAAEELLWESTVVPQERPTWEVWKNQLRAALGGNFVPRLSNAQKGSNFAKNRKMGPAPDVSSISQAPAILSRNNTQLPLDEIIDFNQRTRNRWVQAKAKTIPASSRVLDVGAGTCPYRPFFAHCDYKTQDFKKYMGIKKNKTTEYGEIDYVSDITSIPVPDGSFDVILCTEVLEHIPKPIKAVREMVRIVRPGGRLLITAPLGSGLHQLPYHYYGGLSPEWYRHFLSSFGCRIVEMTPNGGFFKLLAQECARVKWTLPQHQHLHGDNVEFIRHLFGEWLPRYLFALEESCFIDQFTVGYHVEAVKN